MNQTKKDKFVYLGIGLFVMVFYLVSNLKTCFYMFDIYVLFFSSLGIFFIPLIVFFVEHRRVMVKNK